MHGGLREPPTEAEVQGPTPPEESLKEAVRKSTAVKQRGDQKGIKKGIKWLILAKG